MNLQKLSAQLASRDTSKPNNNCVVRKLRLGGPARRRLVKKKKRGGYFYGTVTCSVMGRRPVPGVYVMM
jgi:hypothetical protein